jgi:hypothetical protein
LAASRSEVPGLLALRFFRGGHFAPVIKVLQRSLHFTKDGFASTDFAIKVGQGFAFDSDGTHP